MSIDAIAVSASIVTLLMLLTGVAVRLASRLAVLEVQLGNLVKTIDQLTEDVQQLRDAWLSLSATRARHSRETEVIDGYEIS